MIEFRNIAHFISACENGSLTRAAVVLDIAPSTLSASLKALEGELDLELFRRLAFGLYPTANARWLFRESLPLLLLESHVRRGLASESDPPSLLTVEIRPRFAIGRITKAVLNAVAATEAAEPGVLVHPVWTGENVEASSDAWGDKLDMADAGSIVVAMSGFGRPAGRDETTLLHDPWVLACRFPAACPGLAVAASDLRERTVIVPMGSRATEDEIFAHLRARGFERIRFLPEHLGSLPRLINDHPDAAFLLPNSAVSDRLGLGQVRVAPLEPALVTTITARVSEPGTAADRFVQRLGAAFREGERVTRFDPQLTARRVRYFNLAHRLRSVSAAARAANVAQPALSEQLRKLELTLGVKLFDRRSDGVSPRESSARFAPVASALEEGLRGLKLRGGWAAASESGHIRLGVLPSVSQHGLLVNRIAATILALRARHPLVRLTVQEAPNETLQAWVVQGTVGLAIVETGPPQLPRLPLGASEPLAAIVDPRHNLLPPGPVRLADLVKAPLALPTAQFGLRQLLETAVSALRLELRPALEIDALAMLIALLPHEPVCTVLPVSAVRRELESGELRAHPIVEPQVSRRLFVIYSGERSLTDPERELVGLLRAGLVQEEADGLDGIEAPRPSLTPSRLPMH